MTRNEKKTAIENMAERFMSISDLEGKSMAIMVMFYIHARMRKRRLQSEKTEKTGKTCRTT